MLYVFSAVKEGWQWNKDCKRRHVVAAQMWPAWGKCIVRHGGEQLKDLLHLP